MTYTVCITCGVALHNFPTKGPHMKKDCSLKYHDPECFGLAYMDCKLLKSKCGNFLPMRLEKQTKNTLKLALYLSSSLYITSLFLLLHC